MVKYDFFNQLRRRIDSTFECFDGMFFGELGSGARNAKTNAINLSAFAYAHVGKRGNGKRFRVSPSRRVFLYEYRFHRFLRRFSAYRNHYCLFHCRKLDQRIKNK